MQCIIFSLFDAVIENVRLYDWQCCHRIGGPIERPLKEYLNEVAVHISLTWLDVKRNSPLCRLLYSKRTEKYNCALLSWFSGVVGYHVCLTL